MLIALRDFSIGPHAIVRGESITADQQALLPVGRLESLKAQRYAEEISDEQRVAQAVAGVFDRLAVLEGRVVALEGAAGNMVITSGTAGVMATVGNFTTGVQKRATPVVTKSGKLDGRTRAARERKAS